MAEKKNSDARIRANNKYAAAHYDRINMALPKGSRRLIEYCAKKHGESVNRYVCRVVLEQIRASEFFFSAMGSPRRYHSTDRTNCPLCNDTLHSDTMYHYIKQRDPLGKWKNYCVLDDFVL